MFSLPSQTLYFKLITAATNSEIDLTGKTVTITLTSINNTVGPVTAVATNPLYGTVSVAIPAILPGIYTATAVINGVTNSSLGTILSVKSIPYDSGTVTSFSIEDYNGQATTTDGLTGTIVMNTVTVPMPPLDVKNHVIGAVSLVRSELSLSFVNSLVLKLNGVAITEVVNGSPLIYYRFTNSRGPLSFSNTTNKVAAAASFNITVDGTKVPSTVNTSVLASISLVTPPGGRSVKFNMLNQLPHEPEVISF